jgi:RPA family protein
MKFKKKSTKKQCKTKQIAHKRIMTKLGKKLNEIKCLGIELKKQII